MTDKGSRETFAERLEDHDQIYRPIKKMQKNTHNFAPGTGLVKIRPGARHRKSIVKPSQNRCKKMYLF